MGVAGGLDLEADRREDSGAEGAGTRPAFCGMGLDVKVPKLGIVHCGKWFGPGLWKRLSTYALKRDLLMLLVVFFLVGGARAGGGCEFFHKVGVGRGREIFVGSQGGH